MHFFKKKNSNLSYKYIQSKYMFTNQISFNVIFYFIGFIFLKIRY